MVSRVFLRQALRLANIDFTFCLKADFQSVQFSERVKILFGLSKMDRFLAHPVEILEL